MAREEKKKEEEEESGMEWKHHFCVCSQFKSRCATTNNIILFFKSPTNFMWQQERLTLRL